MAPALDLISCATPPLPWADWVEAGQATVSPLPRVQSVPPTATRYLVKLLVVPEPSERCTTTIGVAGRVLPALSATIAASFQVVILPPKILARVTGLSLRSTIPARLYDTVIGAATVGT